jgi:hypothetical protein
VATTKQKAAVRRNLEKARATQSARAQGKRIPRKTTGLSTAEENRLPDRVFAFPKERKEPLTDARHVRNAVARFDQVEGVSERERDAAWRRIKSAARKYDVEVGPDSWQELFRGGKAKRRG